MNRKSLIKLADNPEEETPDEDSMDYEDEKEDKGKRVNGPRTKLSNSDSVSREDFAKLAKAVKQIATAQKAILDKFDPAMMAAPDENPFEEEDHQMPPMGGHEEPDGDEFGGMGDEFGGGDDLDLDMFGGEFAPYDGEQEAHFRDEGKTMNRVPMNMARKAIVRKDDASSNFGEKDSDIAGNRPLEPDDKEKEATEYLIQGDSSDGPGPVNKALINAVAKAVAAELRKSSKVAKTATSPEHNNSKLEKAVEVTESDLERVRKMDFRELNRLRVEVGDLPAGIL